DELMRLLTQCDQANGFANRILWICCRRSKLLPFGGKVDKADLDRLQKKLGRVAPKAKETTAVNWTREAMGLGEHSYPRLTSQRPGTLGVVPSRAEAHVLRLALLYALMDGSSRIEVEHLRAALALWDYAERSAAYIFGGGTGRNDADRILSALRDAPAG